MLKNNETGKYHHILEIPEKSLVKTDVCGFGFLLMKPKVLLDIYEQDKNPFTSNNENNVGEDVLFFEKVEKFGYKPHVDTSVVVRHVGGSVGMEEYSAYYTLKGERKDGKS